MYSVSADYLTALSAPVKKFRLTGSVGSYSFTQDNVVAGSLQITNRISEGSEIKLGSVYTGQLKCTFTGLNIPRGSWNGKVITLSEGLQLADESFEDVPLGVFTVSQANHTTNGVEVTAYDAMTAFDKNISFDTTSGTPYELLAYICQQRNITLDNTEEEIEAFPNGTETFSIYPENDIESYRDLLYWICQTLCAVATINRSGNLELRQYSDTSLATIDENSRFAGCSFSDFITKYTGMSVVDMGEQFTRYYSIDPDNGLTYNLGQNPLVQYSLNLVQNIIDDFSSIELTPFKATMLGGALFDLGDCLTFSGGIAQGAVCGVMAYNYKYNGGYEIEGFGENPALANARSKVDHDISGLLSIARNEIMYYDFINAAAITVNDSGYIEVIKIRFAPLADTHIDFHAEIKHTVSAGMTVKVRYLLNGEDYGYYPEQIEETGKNLLHLLLAFSVRANTLNTLIVQMTTDDGEATIAVGDARAYLAGYGIGTQELPWDGNIDAQDEWTNILIPSIPFDEASVMDNASVSFITPTAITLAETFQNVPIPSIAFDENGVTDAVTVAFVILSAIIDTNSTVVRDATYTTIASGQFVLQTEYMESSVTEVIDSGYCTKVTPFVTGLTVSDVEIE